MKGTWIKEQEAEKLLIVMMGWSCDDNMLSGFDIEGYDIYAVYDYRTIETNYIFKSINFDKYQSTSLIAWSFGVWATEQVVGELPSLKKAIALNGTTMPVNDMYGIPRRGFKVTLWAIGNMGLDKFNERMVGDYKEHFIPALRPFEEQLDELMILSKLTSQGQEPALNWSNAIVGKKDTIFPTDNQVAFWQRYNTDITMTDMAHYPFTKEGRDLLSTLLCE